MRILNRPMFRSGGPIREGVMHGMRNGGRAALVGNPVYPKTDGREHHNILKTIFGFGSKPAAGIASKPGFISTQVKKYIPKIKEWWRAKPQTGQGVFEKQILGSKTPVHPVKNWFQTSGPGKYLAGSPEGKALKYIWDGKGWVAKAVALPFKSPTAGLGLLYVGGKWLWPDKTPANEIEIKEHLNQGGGKVPGHGDEGMTYTDPSKAEALAKAAQNKRMKSYLDMMGYDSAKKTAMSDALIDASALVQDATTEAGSIKHADWGNLINKAIQTTSKRLDKPEQIREAVGLMATKAAIEKDLEDPQVKALRALEIKTKEKGLDPSPADLALAASGKTGKVTQDILENIVRSNEGVENFRASFKDKKGTAYGEWLDDNTNGSEMKFMNDIVKKESDFGAGFYVFPDRIVEVKDDLTMKYYY